MNTFQGGAIYWSPTTGAHVVYGAIGAEYAALAHETDAYGRNAQLVLGLPTSDEMNVPGVSGARMETFQGGAVLVADHRRPRRLRGHLRPVQEPGGPHQFSGPADQ